MATTPFNYGFGDGEGGGFFIPDTYKFVTQGEANAYFSGHLDELKKYSTFIMIGPLMKVWTGNTNPSGYFASNWKDGNPLISGKDGVDGTAIVDGLTGNDVPTWNSASGKLVPSGVKADDGEITMAPNTLKFGNHSMSSSVENVVFRNEFTHRVYAPVWQELGVNQQSAYIRAYGAVETVERVPVGDIDVVNPVNDRVNIDVDESFLGGRFTLSQSATNVILEVKDYITNELVWRQKLGDMTTGQHTVAFETPLDVKQGYSYRISLSSEDGSDVVAKSNAPTGFSWTVQRVKWTDKEVATKEWVISTGGAGQAAPKTILEVERSSDGTSLLFRHLDGTTTIVQDNGGTTNEQVNTLAREVNSMLSTVKANSAWITRIESDVGTLQKFMRTVEGSYVYSGDSPVLPDNKHFYAIEMTGGNDVRIPETMYGSFILIKSNGGSFRVTTDPDVKIDNKNTLRIPSGSYTLLVKADDNNWVSMDVGRVPTSYNTMLTKVQVDLLDKLHTFDQIDTEMARRGYTRGGTVPVAEPIYGIFGNTWPTTLTGAAQSTSGGSRVTVTKGDDTRKRVFIIVPISRASRVSGIKEDGGLASMWSATDVTIDNKQYRSYVSNQEYSERSATFVVEFNA